MIQTKTPFTMKNAFPGAVLLILSLLFFACAPEGEGKITINGLSPTDGQELTKTRPTLTWQAVVGLSGYEVQITTAANSLEEAEIITVYANNYIPEEDLTEGETYLWRVRGIDGTSSTDWSPTLSITLLPPQRITTAAELEAITDLGGFYQLAADIVLTDTEWSPLGNHTDPFTGIFDGNSYKISGLSPEEGESLTGMFGVIGDEALVRDLTLEDIVVNGAGCAGGLAGINRGRVINCTVSGAVSGSRDYVGGLVGFNYGTIENGVNDASVSGSSDYTGGITGYNNGGRILSAVSRGDITGVNYVGGVAGGDFNGEYTGAEVSCEIAATAGNIGGLAGSHTGFGDITDISVNVTITSGEHIIDISNESLSGGYRVGGLIGHMDSSSEISSCEVTATITGYKEMGGLIGRNDGGYIFECVTSGSLTIDYPDTDYISSTGTVGGLIGYNGPGGIIENSESSCDVLAICSAVNGPQYTTYASKLGGLTGGNYAIENEIVIRGSKASGKVAGGGDHIGGLTGYNSRAVIVDSSFTGEVVGRDKVGGLAGQNSGGSITECLMSGTVEGEDYVGGITGYNEYVSANSVSPESLAVVSDCVSTGSVTGGMYTGGIIGLNEENSSISNCRSEGTIEGGSHIGGIAGINRGTLTHTSSSSAVSGNFSGGLIGTNGGSVTASYATGSVTGSNYLGGLIGLQHSYDARATNSALVKNSYSLSTVAGTSSVGGLVGMNGGRLSYRVDTGYSTYYANITDSGTVENCYAAGTVTLTEGEAEGTDMGGLIGYHYDSSTVNGSFYDELTGQTDTGKGTETSTAEMKSRETFTAAGWGFTGEEINGAESIWSSDSAINSGYPYLNDYSPEL